MPVAASDYPDVRAVATLARRVGIIAVVRFANQPLVIVSPIILVRLLATVAFLVTFVPALLLRLREAVRALRQIRGPVGAEL